VNSLTPKKTITLMENLTKTEELLVGLTVIFFLFTVISITQQKKKEWEIEKNEKLPIPLWNMILVVAFALLLAPITFFVLGNHCKNDIGDDNMFENMLPFNVGGLILMLWIDTLYFVVL
jgi:amino acid transporter